MPDSPDLGGLLASGNPAFSAGAVGLDAIGNAISGGTSSAESSSGGSNRGGDKVFSFGGNANPNISLASQIGLPLIIGAAVLAFLVIRST